MAVWTVRVLDGSDPAPVASTRFLDVGVSDPFAAFIERFAELGVTRGCGDGSRFCPDESVTRAQMAVFLARAYSLPDGPAPGFGDVASDTWYAAEVAALAASGITRGCGDGTRFCPEQLTTRAQMATFLWRAAQRGGAGDSMGGSAGFDPAATPPLGDFDLGRLLAAAEMLDPEADCPEPADPESLEGVAEVLRIENGCAVIDYVPLNGRTVVQARAEILAADPTAHAVGLPPAGLQLDALQGSFYDGAAPSPYDQDDYKAGEWWHLHMLDAAVLWDPEGWDYTDSSGTDRSIPGWPDEAEVIVSVIDSSVYEHDDFKGRLVGSVGGNGWFARWLDDDCHHDGRNKHGTHVAGLIVAEPGNQYATAGVAPRAKILPINLLGDECKKSHPSSRNATRAVLTAVQREVDVINMSFFWPSERAAPGRVRPAGIQGQRRFRRGSSCGTEQRHRRCRSGGQLRLRLQLVGQQLQGTEYASKPSGVSGCDSGRGRQKGRHTRNVQHQQPRCRHRRTRREHTVNTPQVLRNHMHRRFKDRIRNVDGCATGQRRRGPHEGPLPPSNLRTDNHSTLRNRDLYPIHSARSLLDQRIRPRSRTTQSRHRSTRPDDAARGRTHNNDRPARRGPDLGHGRARRQRAGTARVRHPTLPACVDHPRRARRHLRH